MRVPGRKSAQRWFRRTRARLMGGVPVLGYHRVGDGPDPLGLTTSTRHFEAQLEVLSRRARPVRLHEAVETALQGHLARGSVAVTFDDGYADMVETVLPLLEAARIPAMVFVTSGCPGRRFWWDELAAVALDCPSVLGALGLGDGLVPVAAAMQALEPQEREQVMERLRESADMPAPPDGAPRALTTGELQRLAASPCIEIGAHTVSHPALPRLTPEAQRQEIRQCRTDLEAATGRPVRSFSYPHGAYGPETLAIVAEAGFATACCSEPDAVTRRSQPLALPRLWVADSDGETFERWLNGWLAA